jgi:hypothetical protein
VPIEQIKRGDKVACYDLQGKLVSGEVTKIAHKTVDKLIAIQRGCLERI